VVLREGARREKVVIIHRAVYGYLIDIVVINAYYILTKRLSNYICDLRSGDGLRDSGKRFCRTSKINERVERSGKLSP